MSDSTPPDRWPKPGGRRNQSGYNRFKRKQVPSQTETLDDTVLDNALMAQLSLDISDAEQSSSLTPQDASPILGTCIHAVNGVELVTDSEGVAYWPAEDTLLVADLHLEKGSSFARRGQLIPPYDTMATLRRLSACIAKWQPAGVIALGDSFHDKQASDRLSDEAHDTLTGLMAKREWVWITGNHDPEPPKGLGGTVLNELTLGGLLLRHEPQVDAPSGEIAGHLHPKARLIRRGRSVRRSCFAASRSRMILPSFGAYTGGLNVFDPAFSRLFDGSNFHALMRGDGQIYRIAAENLSR